MQLVEEELTHSIIHLKYKVQLAEPTQVMVAVVQAEQPITAEMADRALSFSDIQTLTQLPLVLDLLVQQVHLAVDISAQQLLLAQEL
jgi:hypothetical protein